MSILIVDDSADNRLLLQAILEEEGFGPVFPASSAAEALQILGIPIPPQAGKPPAMIAPSSNVELILMDIMMPKINGIQAVKLIREDPRFHRLPIMMVTARTRGQDLSDAFAAGASDYITKPVDELELVARVRLALVLYHERETRLAREKELEQLKDELLGKNERLNDLLGVMRKDLSAAAELQHSLLPPPASRFGDIDAAWRFHPCDAIGGDLLNLFRFDPVHSGFYVLDVSGHGVSAALLAVALSRSLTHWGREGSLLVNTAGEVRDPVELVSLLNQQFGQSALNPDWVPQYFTMIYGLIDVPRRSLRWVRAGHPSPILSSADGKVTMFEQGDCPVGLDNDAQYSEQTMQLQAGDRFFMYSDGIIEARHPENRKLFGEERLMELLGTKVRGLPLGEACDQVVAAVRDWRGGLPFEDDVTLLAFEVKP